MGLNLKKVQADADNIIETEFDDRIETGTNNEFSNYRQEIGDMMAMDMSQLLDSMENSIKLQGRARAEKRSRQAEREQKEFKEKLMRAATCQMELEGMVQKVKGTDAAVQRDQLTGLMGGF